MCGLPKLIAACHVLHRLSLPRHPPCALSSLTIELTPAQGAESLRSCLGDNLFSASESGLAHSRAQSPHLLKTLFLLEHLPELVTCSNSHVLGLVFNAFRTYSPLMRLAADKWPFQCVTQFILLSNILGLEACAKRSRPEAVETCSLARACFWIEAAAFMQKASIEKQERDLVELTGIEPVTSCLQSTRSPS